MDRLNLKCALFSALAALACCAGARAQSTASPAEHLCTTDSLSVSRGPDNIFEGQRRVLLAWTASTSNPDWYNIYRSAATGGPYVKVASCVTQNSFTDSSVTDGQDTFYVVTAVSSGIESVNSNQGEAQIPVFDSLAVVPNLQGLPLETLTTSAAIGVRQALARAASERLSSSLSLTLSVVAPNSGNLSEDLAISDSARRAQVTRRAASETLSTADAIAGRTGAPVPNSLGAPARLSLTASALPSQVTLRWQPSASRGVIGANVYRHATQGGPYSLLQSLSSPATHFTDFTVAGRTRYCYVVTALANGFESPYSNEACSTPPGGVAAPYRLAVSIRSSRPRLAWTQSSTRGLSGSNVYRSSTSGGPYSLLQSFSSPTTTFTDPGAEPGQTYFYVVTAVSSGQESGYSNEAVTTVP